MKTLTGECAHLLLRRREDLKTLVVEVASSTADAINKWDWTTRSSPIFTFAECNYPDWQTADDAYLFFIGPIDPATWDIDVPCYATLGTYNLVAICIESRNHLFDMRDFVARNSDIPWECWQLSQGKVVKVGLSPTLNASRSFRVARSKVSSGLESAEEENCTLFAAAISKAERYSLDVAAELRTFNEGFKNKLQAGGVNDDNNKLSWLVNVNAALSRFTSQTFSGVSPIAATECHFWSHSLLGVGLATKALGNIRRFTEVAIGDADWLELLTELQTVPLPANWKQLYSRVTGDAASWLDAEAIVESALAKRASSLDTGSVREARLPLIVCYSGRDGFRSTSFSLSAPLEVISQGNAYGWTPITLSHEIAHVWITGVLSKIFPDLEDEVEVQRMDRTAKNSAVETVLDDLRLAFYFAYHFIDLEASNVGLADGASRPPKPWKTLASLHGPQVNELLTHILDYQFFYHQDEAKYIDSIWSSWDVIPNIKERLQSYLIRSACALLSERLNHQDSIKSTLDRLHALLVELRQKMNKSSYLDDAIYLLENDRNDLFKRVQLRQLLVRLAKVFLTNRPIAARLEREQQETGGVYAGLTELKFGVQQILNPMRFLAHYCVDRKGDRTKTLWILTKVAFMQDPHDTFA